MESEILDRLTTLGHPQRMAVFRLLVRRYPDPVPAGEIAAALDLKASTLSVYLSSLLAQGLVTQSRAGTSVRYTARPEAAGEIADYLLLDCCRGRPDLCTAQQAPPKPDTSRMTRPFNVLFICTGNSARSIFAEAILTKEGAGRFHAFSAGTRPTSSLNPLAIEMLEQKGYDVTGLRSKNVEEFQGDDSPEMDFVFTVCDRAANEECPAWPGRPITAHWGQPDPVAAEGTLAERRLAFQQVYGALRNRITSFTALPLETLDAVARQAAVDDLSRKD